MRKYWAGGVVSHRGRFFEFNEIYATPAPSAPVPIYYGGTSNIALRRAATVCDGYVSPGHAIEDITPLMATLKRLRCEASRDHLPSETLVTIRPVEPAPDIDTLKRLQDLGVTSIFRPPFHAGGVDRGRTKSGLGRYSTIDEKKNVMEHYAETIIRKVG